MNARAEAHFSVEPECRFTACSSLFRLRPWEPRAEQHAFNLWRAAEDSQAWCLVLVGR